MFLLTLSRKFRVCLVYPYFLFLIMQRDIPMKQKPRLKAFLGTLIINLSSTFSRITDRRQSRSASKMGFLPISLQINTSAYDAISEDNPSVPFSFAVFSFFWSGKDSIFGTLHLSKLVKTIFPELKLSVNRAYQRCPPENVNLKKCRLACSSHKC